MWVIFHTALEYNPSNEDIYVANQGSGTVSVMGDTSQPSIPPTADAGADQTVDSGDIVQLDGSGSSDPKRSPLTYHWTQTAGPDVTLSDSSSTNPIFTAPPVNKITEITFQLVVTNEDDLHSQSDSVTVTVNPIIPPTADAGVH